MCMKVVHQNALQLLVSGFGPISARRTFQETSADIFSFRLRGQPRRNLIRFGKCAFKSLNIGSIKWALLAAIKTIEDAFAISSVWKLCSRKNSNAIQRSIKSFASWSCCSITCRQQFLISRHRQLFCRSSRKHSSPARFINFLYSSRSANANWRHFLHFGAKFFLWFWVIFLALIIICSRSLFTSCCGEEREVSFENVFFLFGRKNFYE